MAAPPVLLLTRGEVAGLFDEAAAFEAVERAFRARADGEALATALLHVDAPAGEVHVKAGGVPPYLGLKANTGFFANPARHGLPAIQGLIVLFDAERGTPVAVMDSTVITLLRTGAATAGAATRLAPAGARRLAIVGTGRQAEVQLRAVARVSTLDRVDLIGRDAERVALRADALAVATGLDVRAATDVGVAALADVVVTATPATAPVLFARHVRAGAFVAGVGADSPHKHELAVDLIARATVIADVREQVLAVGDTHHAVAAGVVGPGHVVAELGDVLTGRHPGRSDPGETIVYDSTGTALQDVAAAAAVLGRARAEGVGREVDLLGG